MMMVYFKIELYLGDASTLRYRRNNRINVNDFLHLILK